MVSGNHRAERQLGIERGAQFSRKHARGAVCSPGQGGVLTGRRVESEEEGGQPGVDEQASAGWVCPGGGGA